MVQLTQYKHIDLDIDVVPIRREFITWSYNGLINYHISVTQPVSNDELT